MTFGEKALRAAVAGRGAQICALGEFGIGEPPVLLEQAQELQVGAIESVHGRFFHPWTIFRPLHPEAPFPSSVSWSSGYHFGSTFHAACGNFVTANP
jgi:hypothetical protein